MKNKTHLINDKAFLVAHKVRNLLQEIAQSSKNQQAIKAVARFDEFFILINEDGKPADTLVPGRITCDKCRANWNSSSHWHNDGIAQENHVCPYDCELGDGEQECNCCVECENQCANDI